MKDLVVLVAGALVEQLVLQRVVHQLHVREHIVVDLVVVFLEDMGQKEFLFLIILLYGSDRPESDTFHMMFAAAVREPSVRVDVKMRRKSRIKF